MQRGHTYFEDKAIGLSAGRVGLHSDDGQAGALPRQRVHASCSRAAVTIVDARGHAVTVKAGESFLIPKGMPCVWRQDGYIRKSLRDLRRQLGQGTAGSGGA